MSDSAETTASAPEEAVQQRGMRHALENAVNVFHDTYKCDACSLYLYDEPTRTATMKAARGYPMFGKAIVTLKQGEGLTGRVIAERRPIYAEMAKSMHGYIRHHNFPDDDLQTFLGIPLLKGRERVGAIVLQRRTGVPFLAEEISAARLKAAELTETLQNVNALMQAETSVVKNGRQEKLRLTSELRLKGSAASQGWAMAPIKTFSESSASALLDGSVTVYPEAKRALGEAITIVEKRLEAITQALGEKLPEAASAIFETAAMMLHDDMYEGKIRKLAETGLPLTQAIAQVSSEYIEFFKKSPQEYIKEKAHDVEDLALRLLESVTLTAPEINSDTSPHIIVAEKLLPSDIIRISQGNIKGIVLVAGGGTAHVVLLVRSLKIPMMIVPERDLLRLPAGEMMALDCASAAIIAHPDEATRKKLDERAAEEAKERVAYRNIQPETFTADGVKITLMANINILADIDSALEANAEGVGLYRTEFPFIMRQNLPSEVEQQKIYTRVIERMPARPIIFRTLDAGGDKIIPYLFKTREENPALGLRSIRFSLKYPSILDQQLRAILRAIQFTKREDVSIMFPMISSIEEFEAARDHVADCLESIHAELGDRPLITPRIGAMIEVPAILAVIDKLAEESDFFSVGTNDFIQYMLAIDRTNPNVSQHYMPHHPAVLDGLKKIAAAAAAHDTPLSLCGEMGRDPRYIPFLIGIGFRTLSIEPAQIASTQRLISRFSIAQCAEHAAKLLSLSHMAEIETEIDDFAEKVFG